MKLYEILTESKKQEPAKPRNFVAKNAHATTSGAGAHKDKKKAAKQGYEKHKKQGVTESVNGIVQQILSESSLGDFLPPFSANGLWINDRRGNSVAEVRGHGSLAKEVANALNQYVSKKGVAEGKAVYYHVVDDNNKSIKAFMYSQDAIKFVNDRRKKDPTANKWKVVAKKNAVIGEQGVAEGSKWVDDNGDPIPINQGHWADKPGQKKWPAFKNIKTGKKHLHKDDPDFEKGVAEGSADTVHANATVIKSKNGKPVGEIYQDADGSWGCLHYKTDQGYDMIDSREDAIETLRDLHQGLSEGLGAYDNDKGIKHTRGSLVAKLESLPKGDDEFEWHKNRAIYHLKQGNMIRARYYMAKMKRGEQGVAEASMGSLMAANKIRQDKERLSKPTSAKVDNSKAQARDAAWWKAQDDAYKAGKDTFEFGGKTYPLKGKGVAEGEYDIFKKLPTSGSTVKIAGRPVEITHAGANSDYIGYTWTDKNGKEHYEETLARDHSNLRSLANMIADEIKYADDDGVDDELDAQIKGRLDRHFKENIQSVDDWKAAVLQAYPQYADKIKFKGRGLQINAEIPGVDRSFGVYDLGSESGEVLHETATAGATSAGNIATVTSPHLAIGGARGNKSYTGSPGKSGTKAPTPPKTLQKKKADGTAVNALDMKNNIFGGAPVKR